MLGQYDTHRYNHTGVAIDPAVTVLSTAKLPFGPDRIAAGLRNVCYKANYVQSGLFDPLKHCVLDVAVSTDPCVERVALHNSE